MFPHEAALKMTKQNWYETLRMCLTKSKNKCIMSVFWLSNTCTHLHLSPNVSSPSHAQLFTGRNTIKKHKWGSESYQFSHLYFTCSFTYRFIPVPQVYRLSRCGSHVENYTIKAVLAETTDSGNHLKKLCYRPHRGHFLATWMSHDCQTWPDRCRCT